MLRQGNAGTATENKCQNVDVRYFKQSQRLSTLQKNDVAFNYCWPEAPLVNGVVDAARETLKSGGRLNTLHSLKVLKAFAKHFLKRHNILTAFYDVFAKLMLQSLYRTNGA